MNISKQRALLGDTGCFFWEKVKKFGRVLRLGLKKLVFRKILFKVSIASFI